MYNLLSIVRNLVRGFANVKMHKLPVNNLIASKFYFECINNNIIGN